MPPLARLGAPLLAALVLLAGAPASPSAAAGDEVQALDGRDASMLVAVFDTGTAAADRQDAVEDAGGDAVRSVPTLSAEVVSASDDDTADRLRAQPGVRYVEPLVRRTAFADASTPERAELGVEAAQALVPAFDGRGTSIAVLDTGVDARNPDLVGRVVDAGDYTTGRRTTGGTVDGNGHGTGVAALAAAAADGQGIVGTASAARVRSYKVLDAEGGGGSIGLALAIRQVADDAAAGADIVVANMSLGGPFRSRVELDALAYAASRAPQVLFVAASGNDGAARPSFPAAAPLVLSVGASERGSDGTYRRASFSNAADVDVLAPGVDVVTYRYNPEISQPIIGRVSGTSEAAPQVAGIAAGLAAGRDVRGQAAAAALKASAEAAPGSTGREPGVGSGRADARTLAELTDGSRAFSTAFVDDGAYVDPSGRRIVTTRRFVPSGGDLGPATLTTSAGALTAGGTASGGVTGGTLVSQRWAFTPPSQVGVVGSFQTSTPTVTSAPGATPTAEVFDSVPFATLSPLEGERGRPAASREVVRATLGAGGQSALLLSFGVRAGQEFTLRSSSGGGASLFIWLPGAGGSVASSYLEPDEEVDLTGEETYVAPTTGRYLAGFVLTEDGGQNGAYALSVEHPQPAGRVAPPAVTTAGTAGLPFRVHWAGGRSYTVQWMTRSRTSTGWVSGPWRPWLSGTTASSAIFGAGGAPTTVRPGQTFYFRVIATDDLGDTGPVSTALPATVPYDERATGLRYSSGWSAIPASGRFLGTLRVATTAGRTVRLSAEGSEISVVGDRCAACGQVDVYLDGTRRARVDTRAAGTQRRVVLWRSGLLPGGIRNHVLELRTVGTPGRPTVRLDGVALRR